MSHTTIALDQVEETILNFDVSDEELEMAAGPGKQKMANPTAPFAIICIPFADQWTASLTGLAFACGLQDALGMTSAAAYI